MWVIYNTETYKLVTKHYSRKEMKAYFKAFSKVKANQIAYAKHDQWLILKKLATPIDQATKYDDLWNRLKSFKKGEMTVIAAGRQTGKSAFMEQMLGYYRANDASPTELTILKGRKPTTQPTVIIDDFPAYFG